MPTLHILIEIVLGLFGLFHPIFTTHPILKKLWVKGCIALLIIAIVLGWNFYQNKQEDKKIELGKWEFAQKNDTQKDYCTYLEEYPLGEFANQAESKCHPENSTSTNSPQETQTTISISAQESKAAKRYQVNGALVTDTVTKLMWMRCSLGQKWDGSTCVGKAELYNLNDAMKMNGYEHDGFNDWRVPTIDELKSLVYCSSELPKMWNDTGRKCDGAYDGPTIFSSIFPNVFPNMADLSVLPEYAMFWSSSSDGNNHSQAWFVNFMFGISSYSEGYELNAVRLVRNEK